MKRVVCFRLGEIGSNHMVFLPNHFLPGKAVSGDRKSPDRRLQEHFRTDNFLAGTFWNRGDFGLAMPSLVMFINTIHFLRNCLFIRSVN